MLSDDEQCSLRWDPARGGVTIIDQTRLPHTLHWCHLDSLEDYCHAISSMQVRGAPLIGITAAFGLAHALALDPSLDSLEQARATLLATRPTAVNLQWALQQVVAEVSALPSSERAAQALACAQRLRLEDITSCSLIGDFGLQLLQELAVSGTLNIMTHCNAGSLATIQWGTALAPIYKAHAAGLEVHVWVSETRPRNQGMNLTAWELQRAGVPCTVVVDNACGELMRRGDVDCVLVGSDRTAANGDVCNKVGTYLKALSARDNNVPFYVALPWSTIDLDCPSGLDIPIEERDAAEVLSVYGIDANGEGHEVSLAQAGTHACNPAFDITPARLVSGLVTERGIFQASKSALTAPSA